ncbi:TMEM175 family protein [Polaribacter sp. MSW13]|uniref:TMEM175 family protein n=1 Tax=Polaribacter marinus TaxID=2916838 RepID=A0A9X1VMS0_9FLAO|nr:TMEM175 family protein [Polaribacter marinus]
MGLVVSFMVTALYWVAHMRIMKYTSTINNKVLWYNILLLFFIVLLPFSTAFYVKGFNFNGPFAFYCFNLSAIGFFNYLLNVYITKKEKGLTGITPILGKYFKIRALNAFIIWALAGFLTFYLPYMARFLFILLFVFEILLKKYFKKQLKKEAAIE